MVNRKLRKVMAVVLSAAMLLAMAACGSKADEEKEVSDGKEVSDEKETSEGEEVSENTYDPLGKYEETVTVTMASWCPDRTLENGDTAYDNEILDVIKDMMNIEIEREISAANTADVTDALSLAITAGELPDICVMYDYNQFIEAVEEGLIMDLTEVIENYAGEETKALWDGHNSDAFNVMDKVTVDGKVYALPRISAEPGCLVWIRQDWLDALGINIDEDGNKMITRDDLEMVATEFVENDPGKSGNPIGFVLTTDTAGGMYNNINLVASTFGVLPWTWSQQDDGSITNGITDSNMKEALSWWNDMYEKGLLDAQYGVTGDDEFKAAMINGQCGIAFGPRNASNHSFNDVYSADENADFVPYALEDGNGYATFKANDSQNRYLVVSKDCEHPEVAVKLYNFMTAGISGSFDTEEIKQKYPEFYETYVSLENNGYNNFGTLEPANMNCSYTTVATGLIEEVNAWQEGKLEKEDMTSAESIATAVAFEAVEAGTDTATDRIYCDAFEGTSTFYGLWGKGDYEVQYKLNPMTTEAIAMYQADLQKLGTEMIIKIVTGEESVDYFDTFVEEWYSRGGQEIIDSLEEFYK